MDPKYCHGIPNTDPKFNGMTLTPNKSGTLKKEMR